MSSSNPYLGDNDEQIGGEHPNNSDGDDEQIFEAIHNFGGEKRILIDREKNNSGTNENHPYLSFILFSAEFNDARGSTGTKNPLADRDVKAGCVVKDKVSAVMKSVSVNNESPTLRACGLAFFFILPFIL
jgi:hypothetical protein